MGASTQCHVQEPCLYNISQSILGYNSLYIKNHKNHKLAQCSENKSLQSPIIDSSTIIDNKNKLLDTQNQYSHSINSQTDCSSEILNSRTFDQINNSIDENDLNLKEQFTNDNSLIAESNNLLNEIYKMSEQSNFENKIEQSKIKEYQHLEKITVFLLKNHLITLAQVQKIVSVNRNLHLHQ